MTDLTGSQLPSPTRSSDTEDSNASDRHTDGKRLFACYLLVSHAPTRYNRGRTYIGFTVDPCRRLKQHNGLIRYGGAYRTRKHRPWYNVAVIHGFSCKTQAMQFEWAWQHPDRSLTLKTHLGRPDAIPLPTKRKTSVQGALQTLAALVSVPPWCLCPLTLTICADRPLWQKYGIESLSFPPCFRTTFAALESFDRLLTSYDYRQSSDSITPQSSENCAICQLSVSDPRRKNTYCAACGSKFHLLCLAKTRCNHILPNQGTDESGTQTQVETLLPSMVQCRKCKSILHWSLVVRLAYALENDDD